MSARVMGMDVIVEPTRARYVLPDDVPPPTGMTREAFEAWSKWVCGYEPPVIPNGQVWKANGALHMNQETYTRMVHELSGVERGAA